jgi:uncharacterized protein YdcH (DUF465 family)
MNELAYITTKIDAEIKELQNYKKSLRKFFYIESIKGKLKAKHFNMIVDELERLSVEISYLESQKTEYNNIKELTHDKLY